MKNKKNISYVNIYFPPFRGAGAVRAISFLTFLVENGFNVIAYVPKNAIQSKSFDMVRIIAPLPTNKDRIGKRFLLEIIYSLEVFFKVLFTKKTYFAILSSPSFFVTFFASLAFHLKGTKVIVDIRDLYPEVLFRLNVIKKNSITGRILTRMERMLYRNSYKVLIANCYHSESTRKLPSDKLIQVQNGYDKELFVKFKEKQKDFTVCYHGNFGKLYDMDLLRSIIDSVNNRHAGIKFQIIGKGEKDYLFKEKIENLTYISEVQHEKISSYISRCHIGISTTNGDDFVRKIYPVKVFEYIGAKIPSIVVPKGVSGEMVEKNHFGYQFENNELDLIVEKIIELKKNTTLYNEIVQNIADNRDRFTREAQLLKVLEVLT